MTKDIRKKIKLLLIPTAENQFRPRLLSSRFLIYYIALLAILKIVGASYLVLLPKTNFFADISSQTLFALTNENREETGLLPLKENAKLTQAAYLKAQDMLNNDYFSHNSPAGITPWFWIKKANYNYRYAGENLAIGFIDSEETFRAWVNSPSHYANIANSRYQETGIAVLKGDFQGNNTYVVVQMFGSSKPVVNPAAIPKKPLTNQTGGEPKQAVNPSPANPPAIPLNNGSAIVSGSEATDDNLVSVDVSSMIALSSQKIAEIKNNENTLLYKFFRFLSDQYNQILESVVFASLLLLTISLLLNIFIHINIQHRDLILRASLMLLLLVAFVLMNKTQLITFIPHSFVIF